jgi:hypothetical protein
MTIVQLTAHHELSTFVVTVADAFGASKMLPKRESTRYLIRLHNYFEQNGIHVHAALKEIEDYKNIEHIGWKVHYIHSVGTKLHDYKLVCCRIVHYVAANIVSLSQLKVINTNNTDLWDAINNNDYGFSAGWHGIKRIRREIKALQQAIQATKSPDPSKFADGETIQSVVEQFEEFHSKYIYAKTSLRELAISKLRVEDFF